MPAQKNPVILGLLVWGQANVNQGLCNLGAPCMLKWLWFPVHVHHCYNHSQALCNRCCLLNSLTFLSESAWQRQSWRSPWMISFPNFRMIWRKSWTQWSVTSAKGSTSKWTAVIISPLVQQDVSQTTQAAGSWLCRVSIYFSNPCVGETTIKPDSFWG